MISTSARRTPTLWNILKFLFAVFLAGFVLSRTSMSQLTDLLKSISPGWLVLSLLLYASATLLKAIQYYSLIGKGVTYPQILNVVILQNAVSNFLASGAGIASYLTALRMEHDVKVGRSMIVFILTKIGDLIALWLALLISSLWVWHQMGVLQNIVIGLLAGIGFIIVVFFSTVIFRQKFINLIGYFLDRARLSQIRLIQKGMDILQALSEIEQRRLLNRLMLVFSLSLVYFIFSVMWFYSSYRVFNLQLEIPAVIFINVLIQLISYFPIQIFGGLGVTETSALYFWGIFGIATSVLAPVLVGSRILFYLFNLVSLIYLPIHTIFFEKKS